MDTAALIKKLEADARSRGQYVRCPVCNVGIGRHCIGVTVHPERLAAQK